MLYFIRGLHQGEAKERVNCFKNKATKMKEKYGNKITIMLVEKSRTFDQKTLISLKIIAKYNRMTAL